MSHTAGISIVVIGMGQLIAAVIECGFDYQQSRQKFQVDDGTSHDVDVVVSDESGAKVGVQLDAKTGVAKFIAHDCQGGRGQALAGKIAQRYAYSQVIGELRRKGYVVGKEEKQPDGTVRLVASRWK